VQNYSCNFISKCVLCWHDLGVVMAIILALLPSVCRLSDAGHEVTPGTDAAPPDAVSVTVVELTGTLLSSLSDSLLLLINVALGDTLW
jgi:predicted secreted protein